jgi:hypothetical protein
MHKRCGALSMDGLEKDKGFFDMHSVLEIHKTYIFYSMCVCVCVYEEKTALSIGDA